MLKRIFLCAAVVCVAAPVHAGWFDFLSGSDDEVSTAPVAKTAAAGTSVDMLNQGMALLPLLSESLSVTEDQASGGMGALLGTAKSMLPASDFGTLADAIPGALGMMVDAPKVADSSTEGSGLLGSVIDIAAEHSDTVKMAKDLTEQFKALGLSADMIPKFTDTASNYLKQNGSPEAATMLSSIIGQLF
ncbi:MAG: DUF2780 domain-containing protein [Spongiibacteraceae bacterium]